MRIATFLLLVIGLYGQSLPLGGIPVASVAQAATPTFSPVAGTYSGTQSVTISTTTSGATICYTTNGSDPAASTPGTCSAGSTYSAAVSVASSETLKALATKAAMTNSAIGSAAYTITVAITAPTYVNECNNFANYSATGCTITGVTAGHVLLIGVAVNDSATVTGCTDTNGSPALITSQANSSTGWNSYAYSVSNAASGSHVINCSLSGGDSHKTHLSVIEYDTKGNTSPIDVYNTGVCLSSCSATLSTAAFVTSQNNDLIWEFGMSTGATTAETSPISFTTRAGPSGSSGVSVFADAVASAAGSYTANISAGGAAATVIAVAIKGQ